MEEMLKIFSLLFQSLRNEILDYYTKCHSYIKELFIEKNIDLKIKTQHESDETIKMTVEKMFKTIRITLAAFGVSRDRLEADTMQFKEIFNKRGENYPDYNSYYEKDLKNYFNENLLEILIEYLIDLDHHKIDNLDLYNLVPQDFIIKLNLFKKETITSPQIRRLIGERISELANYINPTDLEVPLIKELKAAKIDNIEAYKMAIKTSAEISKAEIEEEQDESKKAVIVVCPICNSEEIVKIPIAIINQASRLTSVYIPKNLICDHHFQAFVDKKFKIRGYQKIDYEIG